MDVVFAHKIGHNLNVYVDDMIVKTDEGSNHVADLEHGMQSFMKYNIRLNPAKCFFRVQVGKFLGYMLKKRGIEANPNKCQAAIHKRSPHNIKEV